jgi:hypothetical protein
MKKFLWAIALLAAAALAPSGAQAQSSLVKVSCAPTNPFAAGQTGRPFSIDENGNTCITGSISASLTGFTPGLTFASLTASAASGSVALPAGTTVAFQNTGTTTVSCTMGVGSATAVAGQIQVPASSTVFVTPGSNTWGACINESGVASNVVRLAGGSGLGTGFGGGGGGGGGGAVTIADGADATQGAIADAAATAGSTGTLSAKLRLMTTQLDSINTNVQGSIPAGTAYIGKTRETDGTNDALVGPCDSVAKTYTPINISTATTTRIITETASVRTYICSIHVVTQAANNVAMIEGTGASCAGGTPAGMAGGTTAASGWNFSANGGISLGNGASAVAATANQAYSVCLVSSAATQLSGTVAWVQR